MPFAPTENVCFYDMRVVDFSGGTLDFQKINLCSISKVTLFYANGVTWATVE